MGKAQMGVLVASLHGRVGDVVFKRYRNRIVITKVPNMAHVVPSAKQLAHRKHVKAAGRFYQEVKADPALLAKYKALAKKRRMPLSAVTLAEYFAAKKKAE